MQSGIYSIRNVINEKIYIGQSKNVKNRLKNHLVELRSGIHINYLLQRDFDEYKEENFIFEKIHECSEEFLNPMEKYFIEKYNTTNNGYNIKNGNSTVNSKFKKKINQKDKITNDLVQELYSLSVVDVYVDEVTYAECKLCLDIQKVLNQHLSEESNIINSSLKTKEVLNNKYLNSLWENTYECETLIWKKAIEKLKKYIDIMPSKNKPTEDELLYDLEKSMPFITLSYGDKGSTDIHINLIKE